MQVHQKQGESLRDYMQRFNKSTLDIDNVPDTICLSALLHGLKPGRFLDNLLGNPPKSWNEVNDKSASFILSEDFQSSKRRADDKQGKEPRQPDGRDEKKKQKVGEQRGKLSSYPKYDSYIPLSSLRPECSRSQGICSPSNDDYKRADGELDVMMPHADPFVATVHIGNHNVNKVFIDIGSSPDILYWSCFQKMQLNPSSLQKYERPIYGFDNQPVPVEGVITLPIYVGSEPCFRMASVSFLVVKMESAFNAILERATPYELKAVISQPHLCIKFPTPQGVGVLKGNQKMARACYQDTFKKVKLAAAPRGFSGSHRPTQSDQQTMSISNIEHRPKVTSKRAEDHIDDLNETFQNLRRVQMKLNPLKYTFAVESGKFLGYVVSKKGIGVNPEKVQAAQQMEPPKTVKDVQRLIGRVAALHRAPVYLVWVLYMDGATNIEGSGAGAVLVGPDGFKSEHALRFKFQTINNVAEYEALIYGLKLAFELKVQSIKIFSDSQLVVGQVNDSYEIRDPQLGRYASVINRLKSGFASFQIDKIPRADNQRADELSKLASSQDINPQRSTIVEVLDTSSYTNFTIECHLLSTDPSSSSWTTPLIEYLQSGELPEDPSTTKLIKRKAAHFTSLDNQLYKRAASMPLLRCLTPYEAKYAVREVHEGVCGTHIGVNLLGPFVKGEGGCTYLVVAVDYFTKWIEAKPLSTTTEKKIEEFLFNSILCRFGIPKLIIADNGPQFRAAALRSFCNDYGIELALTSVYTPQSNGQAESANKIILRGLKTRVLAAHSNWVDELNKVLWSCRTTPSSAIGKTPFSLAYEAEVVTLVEVGLPSNRASRHDDPSNELLLKENLDLVEEVREMSRIRNMSHQGRVARFYNKRVQARQFQVGDLVLRNAGLTTAFSHMGKLAPNWEGPYMVIFIKQPGSYQLADLQGRHLPFIWNIHNLRKFYS
ncbi:hypothetical protein SLEP1_g53483 [Rubroshorea leprosula]|uniref:Uncharacterized protein n=1 Tax=Rubroshorea leprosula TaxID=152421 RepID=A0AAV5M9M7_9ROSI|nr:hypothetical protein SLEP1_g53483 [Rubroshorea leprosula]